jgi:SulP family sulfate permease
VEEVVEDYKRLGITILFTGVKGPVRDAMSRAHLTEKIGEQNFFLSIQDAVDYIDQALTDDIKTERKPYALQTNE